LRAEAFERLPFLLIQLLERLLEAVDLLLKFRSQPGQLLAAALAAAQRVDRVFPLLGDALNAGRRGIDLIS